MDQPTSVEDKMDALRKSVGGRFPTKESAIINIKKYIHNYGVIKYERIMSGKENQVNMDDADAMMASLSLLHVYGVPKEEFEMICALRL